MISELADRFERRAKTKRSKRVIETVQERPFRQWLLPACATSQGFLDLIEKKQAIHSNQKTR
jgi:hypothetical protein